jgi:RNA-binding protein
MIPLTTNQKKKLKSLAHHLKPVVFIGHNGITDGVIEATDKALAAHELIKVKFIDFKDEKKSIIQNLAENTSSMCVNIIGNIAILFRQNEDIRKRRVVADQIKGIRL